MECGNRHEHDFGLVKPGNIKSSDKIQKHYTAPSHQTEVMYKKTQIRDQINKEDEDGPFLCAACHGTVRSDSLAKTSCMRVHSPDKKEQFNVFLM